MTTVTKKGAKAAAQPVGAPYGNSTVLRYHFETNSSGVFVDSDQTTAVNSGDKVRLGLIPAGFILDDALAIISDAFTASVTFTIGWEYADGVDVTATPQDNDYFFAALSAASAGRTAATNTAVAPVKLPKDAYLILTVGGANNASVGIADIIVRGEYRGAP